MMNQKVKMASFAEVRAAPISYISLISLIILQPSSAQAYIDPGSGSMILQIVIGAVAGGLVAVRLFWHRVRSFFTGQNKNPSDQAHQRGNDE